jgi:hypothetical protein
MVLKPKREVYTIRRQNNVIHYLIFFKSGDRITLSKFAAVCFSFSGVVLVSYSDISIEGGRIPTGAIWSANMVSIIILHSCILLIYSV